MAIINVVKPNQDQHNAVRGWAVGDIKDVVTSYAPDIAIGGADVQPRTTTAVAQHQLTEDAITRTVSGTVSVANLDTDSTTHTLSVTRNGITVMADNAGENLDMPTEYGTLRLSVDGKYTYTSNNDAEAVQGLAAGESVVESFVVRTTDMHGVFRENALTVTITGTNDVPILKNFNAAGILSDNLTVQESGVLAPNTPFGGLLIDVGSDSTENVTDVDGDSLTFVFQLDGARVSTLYATENGFVTGDPPAAVEVLGVLTLDQNTGQPTFTLNDNNPTVNALSAAESISLPQAFVFVQDTQGALSNNSKTVNVEIEGTNDRPIFSLRDLSVTEDVIGLPVKGVLINLFDAENDALSYSVGAANSTAPTGNTTCVGLYGTLNIDTNGTYSYSLNNTASAIQTLNTDEIVSDIFKVYVQDINGAWSTQNLTVSINGMNEMAVNAMPVIEPLVHDDSISGYIGHDDSDDQQHSESESSKIDGDTLTTLSLSDMNTMPMAASLTVSPDDLQYDTVNLNVQEELRYTDFFILNEHSFFGDDNAQDLIPTRKDTNTQPILTVDNMDAYSGVFAATDPDIIHHEGHIASIHYHNSEALTYAFGYVVPTFQEIFFGKEFSQLNLLFKQNHAIEHVMSTLKDKLTDLFPGSLNQDVLNALQAAFATMQPTWTTLGNVTEYSFQDIYDDFLIDIAQLAPVIDGAKTTIYGLYGKLTINADTNTYEYTEYTWEEAQHNPASLIAYVALHMRGDSNEALPTEQFTITVTDHWGASASQNLSFTVLGNNEAPLVFDDGVVEYTVQEAGVEIMSDGHVVLNLVDSGVPAMMGIVPVAASDFDDTRSLTYTVADSTIVSVTSMSVSGVDFTYDTTVDVDGGNLYLNSINGAYVFVVDQKEADKLNEGEDLLFRFSFTAKDSTHVIKDYVVHMRLEGSNDKPILTLDTEQHNIIYTYNEPDSVQSVIGTLIGTDPDANGSKGDVLTFSASYIHPEEALLPGGFTPKLFEALSELPQSVDEAYGLYGKLSIDNITDTYAYTLYTWEEAKDNSATAAAYVDLHSGTKHDDALLTEQFTVSVKDELGAWDSKLLSFSVQGMNNVLGSEKKDELFDDADDNIFIGGKDDTLPDATTNDDLFTSDTTIIKIDDILVDDGCDDFELLLSSTLNKTDIQQALVSSNIQDVELFVFGQGAENLGGSVDVVLNRLGLSLDRNGTLFDKTLSDTHGAWSSDMLTIDGKNYDVYTVDAHTPHDTKDDLIMIAEKGMIELN